MSWLNEDREIGTDNRREVRRKIKLLAVLYDPETKVRTPVTIVNLSHRGAGLRCDDTDWVPDEFTLFIRNDESMRRDCVVVRRTKNELGVRFRNR
jgi:hypothetical protein